jgi:hypothetical protein
MHDIDVVDTEYRPAQSMSTELSKFMPVFTIEVLAERRKIIQQAFDLVMKDGIDYGVFPGTEPRKDKDGKLVPPPKSLYKPGAEQLCTLFGFVPKFEILENVQDFTGEDHGGEPFIYYMIECTLIKNRDAVGSAIGSCNSWEKKYRYRNAERTCPKCSKPNIRPSKEGGYYCWKKTDGCGATFAENDKRITDQAQEQKANPDIYDVINTILKQSEKRSLVAAVLVATGASAFFTQDIEDMSGINKDVKEGEGYKRKPINLTRHDGTVAKPGVLHGDEDAHDDVYPAGNPKDLQDAYDNREYQQRRSANAPPEIRWGDRFTELAGLFGVDVLVLAKNKQGKPWQRRLIGVEELPENALELACKPLQAVLDVYGKGAIPGKLRDVAEMALDRTLESLTEVSGKEWANVIAWMQSRTAASQMPERMSPTEYTTGLSEDTDE